MSIRNQAIHFNRDLGLLFFFNTNIYDTVDLNESTLLVWYSRPSDFLLLTKIHPRGHEY